MSMNDADLLDLLSDLESDRVERKETFKGDAPTKIRQAVAAFANDLPDHRLPGVVFVGATDAGAPSGLPITDELLRSLADIKTDGRTLPAPTLVVEKRRLNDQDLAVITVTPAHAPPVRFDGRIWIRIGPRRGLATAQDERILNERRRFRDLPFDVQPVPSSELADLDRMYYETEYLPATVASDVLAANDRSYEQRLASSRLIAGISDPVPTVLGHLIIGVRGRDFLPGAYVQFLRIDGDNLSEPIVDEAVIDGRLADVLRRVDDKLKAHLATAVNIVGADLERRSRSYPLPALQQLVRNAVMHRSYENTNAPVRISWFSSRIEIWNPGGPFGAVTSENFGQPGFADYRNPHIAEALKALGFVQRFGVGIQTARAELNRNGNPAPSFDVSPAAVSVTIGSRV